MRVWRAKPKKSRSLYLSTAALAATLTEVCVIFLAVSNLGLRRNVVNGRRKLGQDHEGVKKVSILHNLSSLFFHHKNWKKNLKKPETLKSH